MELGGPQTLPIPEPDPLDWTKFASGASFCFNSLRMPLSFHSAIPFGCAFVRKWHCIVVNVEPLLCSTLWQLVCWVNAFVALQKA